MKADINTFSFAQMTSNSDGKTSGTGTMGILICTVGSFSFLLGCVDKLFINNDINIITQSIIFVGIGATLLGYRKSQEKLIPSDSSTPIINQDQLNSSDKPLNS
jgi:hypothetical protein